MEECPWDFQDLHSFQELKKSWFTAALFIPHIKCHLLSVHAASNFVCSTGQLGIAKHFCLVALLLHIPSLTKEANTVDLLPILNNVGYQDL